MTFSPLAQLRLGAVLVTAIGLLGCKGPETTASEQGPPVSATPEASQPPLVTVVTNLSTNQVNVTNLVAGTNLVQAPTLIDPPPPKPVTLSPALQEVVKLAQSGVGDDVILAFIKNSSTPFNPSPDEIVYLTDLGLSDVVITALVNHRTNQAHVAEQPAPAPPAVPPSAPQPAQPTVVQPTYNPEPQVVYGPPPSVEYAAPQPAVEYVAPQPAVEYDYFYSSLAPYGSWVEVADYGFCWQPTVAVIYPTWRPYCDRGRWLYTDCGWYWHSDYSWGWAPFHYGRWFHHPARGWCWRPDSAWGPAWVSWRYTPTHCGWAPLPPGSHYRAGVGFTYYGAHVGSGFSFGLHYESWNFVPAHRFHDRDVWKHRVSPREHVALYKESKVVNNYVINNNTVINRGLGPERVPGINRGTGRPVAVRDLPERGPSYIRPDRPRQEGAEVVVYRPKPISTSQQNVRNVESAGGRSIPSRSLANSPTGQPGSGQVTSQAGGSLRPLPGSQLAPARSEPRPTDLGANRPIRAVGSNPSASSAGSTVSTPTPNLAPATVSPTRPSATPGLSRPTETRPAPAAVTTPQPATRNPTSVSGAAPIRSRDESSRTSSPAERANSVAPQAAGAPTPVPSRRESAPSTVAPARPSAPGSTTTRPQTYRAPGTGSASVVGSPSVPGAAGRSPAIQSSTASGPQPSAVSPPAPTYRQERSKPATSVAPEKYMATQSRGSGGDASPAIRSVPSPQPSFSVPSQAARPAPSYSSPAQSRPAPSYSAPAAVSRPAPVYSAPAVQSRPAPTYSAPAVQSRPAPTYSAPAQPAQSFSAPPSRPAPQAAPAPSATSRSSGRRD